MEYVNQYDEGLSCPYDLTSDEVSVIFPCGYELSEKSSDRDIKFKRVRKSCNLGSKLANTNIYKSPRPVVFGLCVHLKRK